MLYFGDIVYPRKLNNDCKATREEMERLYGMITDISNKKYKVYWIDAEIKRIPYFRHNLKYAWWGEDELTTHQSYYIDMLEKELPNEMDDNVEFLMEDIENAIETYCFNSTGFDKDDDGAEEVYKEFRKEIITKTIKRLKKEIE